MSKYMVFVFILSPVGLASLVSNAVEPDPLECARRLGQEQIHRAETNAPLMELPIVDADGHLDPVLVELFGRIFNQRFDQPPVLRVHSPHPMPYLEVVADHSLSDPFRRVRILRVMTGLNEIAAVVAESNQQGHITHDVHVRRPRALAMLRFDVLQLLGLDEPWLMRGSGPEKMASLADGRLRLDESKSTGLSHNGSAQLLSVTAEFFPPGAFAFEVRRLPGGNLVLITRPAGSTHQLFDANQTSELRNAVRWALTAILLKTTPNSKITVHLPDHSVVLTDVIAEPTYDRLTARDRRAVELIVARVVDYLPRD